MFVLMMFSLKLFERRNKNENNEEEICHPLTVNTVITEFFFFFFFFLVVYLQGFFLLLSLFSMHTVKSIVLPELSLSLFLSHSSVLSWIVTIELFVRIIDARHFQQGRINNRQTDLMTFPSFFLLLLSVNDQSLLLLLLSHVCLLERATCTLLIVSTQ